MAIFKTGPKNSIRLGVTLRFGDGARLSPLPCTQGRGGKFSSRLQRSPRHKSQIAKSQSPSPSRTGERGRDRNRLVCAARAPAAAPAATPSWASVGAPGAAPAAATPAAAAAFAAAAFAAWAAVAAAAGASVASPAPAAVPAPASATSAAAAVIVVAAVADGLVGVADVQVLILAPAAGGSADWLGIAVAFLLHRRLAGQLDAALVVDQDHLHPHLVAHLHDVGDTVDVLVGQLAHVEIGRASCRESAEV